MNVITRYFWQYLKIINSNWSTMLGKQFTVYVSLSSHTHGYMCLYIYQKWWTWLLRIQDWQSLQRWTLQKNSKRASKRVVLDFSQSTYFALQSWYIEKCCKMPYWKLWTDQNLDIISSNKSKWITQMHKIVMHRIYCLSAKSHDSCYNQGSSISLVENN